MTEDITAVREAVRRSLLLDFAVVPPQHATSQQVHLEVWQVRGRDRVVGIEYHPARVNLWVTAQNLPAGLPSTIDRDDKLPKGRGWIGKDGKGANSNLSAYDAFRTRKIARLGVMTTADVERILGHLLR
ncbi:hypothetical protein [Tabrizicola sp. BL-A-41-H6]|uniref:hypothetical protein n=1 Tax=Tabrizicola sp. BL-A-41-H6 TaxID=3421107 RepID=UPI003D673E34